MTRRGFDYPELALEDLRKRVDVIGRSAMVSAMKGLNAIVKQAHDACLNFGKALELIMKRRK